MQNNNTNFFSLKISELENKCKINLEERKKPYIFVSTITNNDMTTAALITKLTKMNVSYTVLDINGYNKDIQFSINGFTFKAGFIEGKNIVEDFCREICYNKSEQEMQRRFFDNFNKVLQYANR